MLFFLYCGTFRLEKISFYLTKKYVIYSKITQIDIDAEILKRFEQRATPLPWDYLARRKKLLTIDVYHGSVDSPHECLLNTDVVVCVEL